MDHFFYKRIFFLVSLSGAFVAHAVSYEQECQSPEPTHFEARHIEGKGIGYHEGYTTLSAFLTSPYFFSRQFIPFVDLRGHIFNDGKPAANVGMGLRAIASRVWGINAYYDYRKTSHHSYHQASCGLESLGRIWDARINGYLPFGAKKSSLFHPYTFDRFKKHSLLVSSKREFAMKGIDAEVGAHIKDSKNVHLYTAAGPYYFGGEGKNGYGGKGRLLATFYDSIRAEVIASYDTVFNGIVQGQLAFVFPFGRKKMLKKPPISCDTQYALWKRALQSVDRSEIIAIDKKKKTKAAVNPATGDPYFFWFVDNTSSSSGTFESPFPTLAQAQERSGSNDVIYVFPGDGTTKGMNAGYVMKDYQKILGSGRAYAFDTEQGSIVVPAMSATAPLITNLQGPSTNTTTGVGVGIITLAHHCEVAGLHLTASTKEVYAGIVGGEAVETGSMVEGITDTSIHDNTLSDLKAFQGAIYLHNCSGELFVANNTISNVSFTSAGGFGHGIVFLTENLNMTYSADVSKNTITNVPRTGITFIHQSPATVYAMVTENSITNAGNQGMTLSSNSTLTANLTISDNIITDPIANGILLNALSGSVWNNGVFTIANNTISSPTSSGVLLSHAGTSFSNLVDIEGNAILVPGNNGITVNNTVGGGTLDGTIKITKNNLVTDPVNSGIFFINQGATMSANTTISENTVTLAVNGILINNSSASSTLRGTYTIQGNTITNSSANAIGCLNSTGISNASFTIANNTLTQGTSGVFVTHFNGATTFNVSNNTLSQLSTSSTVGAIDIRSQITSPGTSSMCVKVLNNTESSSTGRSLILQSRGAATYKAEVSGNEFLSSALPTQVLSQNTSTMCLKFTNNTTNASFSFTDTAPSTFNREPLSGNVGTVTDSGTINTVASGACACQ